MGMIHAEAVGYCIVYIHIHMRWSHQFNTFVDILVPLTTCPSITLLVRCSNVTPVLSALYDHEWILCFV